MNRMNRQNAVLLASSARKASQPVASLCVNTTTKPKTKTGF